MEDQMSPVKTSINVTAGLLILLAGVVLMLLAAFDIGSNDTVSLAWLGAALAFIGVKVP